MSPFFDGGIDGGFLHCFVDHGLAPGYIAWMVPGVGVIQGGLARTLPGKPDLRGLLEKLRPISDLTAARPVGLRTSLVPIGGPVRPFATERVLLIGDAAGLVSPMTAGGIHNAFHFGRRAAQAISDHLFDHGPEPGAVLAAEIPNYRLKRLARALMSLGVPDWTFELALRTPPLRALAEHIYFHHRGPAHERRNSGYFKPLAGS